MPVIRQTLAAAAQFDGTAGSGLIIMPVGNASGADVDNSDAWAAKIILIALNCDNGALIPTGSVLLVPPAAPPPPPSDLIQVKKWTAGLSGFILPCNLPVPQTYELKVFTGILLDEATLTVWWEGGNP